MGLLISVHPRACGEQGSVASGATGVLGSSPRLRGTDNSACVFISFLRFIPAPAGNSRPGRSSTAWLTVHPRACGEQYVRRPFLKQVLALSVHPRACGEQIDNHPLSPAGKLINTVHPRACGEQMLQGNASLRLTLSAVHPRACGEQLRCISDLGSSPRLRGTDLCRYPSTVRFIPAPAGNSLTVMSMMWFDLQVAMISTSFRLG